MSMDFFQIDDQHNLIRESIKNWINKQIDSRINYLSLIPIPKK